MPTARAETDPEPIGIPWRTHDQWSAANEAMAYFAASRRSRLTRVFREAAALARDLERLHRAAVALAWATCRFCPSPCCLAAAPWYDTADLVLLHFGGIAIPEGQPIGRYGDTCRYNGPSGCRLPRLQRPWICAWYTCPQQHAALSKDPELRRFYPALAAHIHRRRRRLERAFIDGTAGRGARPAGAAANRRPAGAPPDARCIS